ncbi:DMT family transporter [Pseudomonas sp. 3A(2025)]
MLTTSTQAPVSRTRLGIGLCVLSMLVFACQDGITKSLIQQLSAAQLVMMRYWVFVVFAVVLARHQGGVRLAARSTHTGLQLLRGLLGVVEIGLFALALRYLGLAETHALYAVFPLLAIALAAIFLREKISSRQVLAAFIGFAGTLVILRPGLAAFNMAAIIPLLAALCFAVFNVLSRKISGTDSFATNTLYMAVVGAVGSTYFGVTHWVEPDAGQWLFIAVLSVSGVTAQLLIIQALKYTEASTLQPFNYSLLVFATLVGIFAFAEVPDIWIVAGSLMVVGGGMLAFKTSRAT